MCGLGIIGQRNPGVLSMDTALQDLNLKRSITQIITASDMEILKEDVQTVGGKKTQFFFYISA